MGRFLFRAQDLNMTNGEYAFFTFRAIRNADIEQPWNKYVSDSDDLSHRRQAFYAVKEVSACSHYRQHCIIMTYVLYKFQVRNLSGKYDTLQHFHCYPMNKWVDINDISAHNRILSVVENMMYCTYSHLIYLLGRYFL